MSSVLTVGYVRVCCSLRLKMKPLGSVGWVLPIPIYWSVRHGSFPAVGVEFVASPPKAHQSPAYSTVSAVQGPTVHSLFFYTFKPPRPDRRPSCLAAPTQPPRQISFDPRSRFARPGDQLILSWRMPRGGGGYRRLCPCPPEGGDGGRTSTDAGDETSQSWPGVGGEPPLVVMAESLTVRFVSASAAPAGTGSGADGEKSGVGSRLVARAWGFLMTARGREVRGVEVKQFLVCPARVVDVECGGAVMTWSLMVFLGGRRYTTIDDGVLALLRVAAKLSGVLVLPAVFLFYPSMGLRKRSLEIFSLLGCK